MRRRIRVASTAAGDEAVINLTPLIDVVFVMLIMFIVVAPILELDQIQLAKGSPQSKDAAASIQETSQVVIHVRKDNKVFLNQQPVSQQQLASRLRERYQEYPTATPLLVHDRSAYFGTYQDVKNAVEGAGFKEMNVILEP